MARAHGRVPGATGNDQALSPDPRSSQSYGIYNSNPVWWKSSDKNRHPLVDIASHDSPHISVQSLEWYITHHTTILAHHGVLANLYRQRRASAASGAVAVPVVVRSKPCLVRYVPYAHQHNICCWKSILLQLQYNQRVFFRHKHYQVSISLIGNIG